MIRSISAVLLLLVSCYGSTYPWYEQVVRDPRSFDLLYSSTAGPINETWYFNRNVNLTAVILPSQVFDMTCSDSWLRGVYQEDIEVRIYETRLGVTPLTYEKASGSYSGNMTFGHEIHVQVQSSGSPDSPTVGRYINTSNGFRYTISVVFKRTGIYPWYTKRSLSTLSALTSATDGQGFSIGFAFTLI